MKKFILSIVCVCILFMNISATAAPDAKTYERNISVYGRLEAEREGDDVSILVYDNDTTLDKLDRVLHIGMTKVQYGGEYQYKFKYTMPSGKTLDDYTVMAKIGADDITQSIISIEEDKMNAFEVSLRLDAYFEPEVTITNKLESAKGAKVILTSYTKDHELAGLKIVDTSVPYDKEGEGYVVNIADLGGDYIKAFMWDSELVQLPLAMPDEANMAADTKFKDGDVVSITGSSSVELSTAPTFIDHFYQTRYPDIDVTIHNTGIGGDRVYMVLDRLEWDVYYGNPNKLYLLCGGNDIKYWEYGVGKEELTEDKIQAIYNSISNYQKFIDTMNEDGKDFVFLGTAPYDEGDYTGAPYGDTFYKGANKAFGILNHKIAELAKERGVKHIDFFNYVTQITNKIREADPTAPALSKVGDRIHLTDEGYLVEGALILLAQGNDEIVSTVDIDVNNTKNAIIKNADVNITEASATKVSYEYAPKSIPLANGTWYKAADKIYPITEKLNQEIIKVAGLENGTYTIKFVGEDSEYIIGTYESDELAHGINIAINENNPGQIQSMTAMAKQVERKDSEFKARQTVKTIVSNETSSDETAIAALNAKKDAAQAYAKQAKELSIPKTYTVTIEKN